MESDDLKTQLQDFAQQLSDNYRCESPVLMMHPRGYDRWERKIQDGDTTPEMAAWFRNNVRRGEYME
jgi:hypothetical protein